MLDIDFDNLSGAQLSAMVDAITESFDENQLGRLLRLRLNKKLADLAGPGRWIDRVFEVVNESQKQGFCPQLVEALELERPDTNCIKALRTQLCRLQKAPSAAGHGIVEASKGNVRLNGGSNTLTLSRLTESNAPAASTVFALSPFGRQTSFIGRQTEIESLRSWLEDSRPILARSIVGPPGVGKTRLAIELMGAAAESWASGFLRNEHLTRFVASGWADSWTWDRPTLIIIDYAGRKSEDIGTWLQILSDRYADHATLPAHKLRILLLERSASLNSGWFGEVFGMAGSWSDRRLNLSDPQYPVDLSPIKDPKVSIALIADTQRCLSRDSSTKPGDVFSRLSNSADAEQLVGNPLLLQIAAVERSERTTAVSRTRLLDAVVAREIVRFKGIWRDAKISEFLWPYLLQLIAAVNLLQGSEVGRITELIDTCKEFAVLRRIAEPTHILDALSVVGLSDGAMRLRSMQPDLIADLFTAQAQLSDETVVSIASFDLHAVGTRLWQIHGDFQDNEDTSQRTLDWIRAVARSLSSVALDMFIRDARVIRQDNATIIAEMQSLVTEALRRGEDTAETLLTGPAERNDIIANSLIRESEALVKTGQFKIALPKLDEAKRLQSHGKEEYGIDNFLRRIEMQIACYKAIDDTDAVLNAIDEGVDLCEQWIAKGIFYGGATIDSKFQSLIDQFDAADEELSLTARGLGAFLGAAKIADYRIYQASLIHQRIIAEGYPLEKTIVAVDRCREVLEGDRHATLLEAAMFYHTKSVLFSSRRDYARVFRDKEVSLRSSAEALRTDALHLILALKAIVIGTFKKGAVKRRQIAFKEAIDCLEFALKHGVSLRHRQLVDLLLCFMPCFKGELSDQFWQDFNVVLKNDPIPAMELERLAGFLDEMMRNLSLPPRPGLANQFLMALKNGEQCAEPFPKKFSG